MASDKKLNPNAVPYPVFSHYVMTGVSTEQFAMVPGHYQCVFICHQPVPTAPLLFNLDTRTSYFLPSYCGKGFGFVAERGFEDEAVKIGCKKKIVSFGGKGQQWLPMNLAVEESRLMKKESKDTFGGKTSLMIRNIPNQFQRHNLLRILDKHCVEVNKKEAKGSAYDFLYLPMDFKTGGNFGYAFVNFTSSAGATRFFKAFNNYEWNVHANKKTCKICCARIQGKVALTSHFKNSIFSCSRSDYLPVVLSPPRDGVVCSSVVAIGRHRGIDLTLKG